MKYGVGIDVSKGKSTISILSIIGEVIEMPFEINHDEQGLKLLEEKIKDIPKEDLKIVMEETGTYHLPILTYLLDKEYFVVAENALKIKNLNIRKADLQKQIKMEDKKRNRAIDGVDPETMEAINDKQDSICLALRSELSDIQLELNELIPQKTILQLIQQHPVKPGKKDIKEDD